MGTCTGVISSCGVSVRIIFFALIVPGPTVTTLFRRCHSAKVIVYDTITKFGWSVHIANHLINVIAEKILHEDWDKENEVGHEEDCGTSSYVHLRLVV
jgi:putative lipase involved disintegration of autophagic bodies